MDSLMSREPRTLVRVEGACGIDTLRYALPPVGEHLKEGAIQEDAQLQSLTIAQLKRRLLGTHGC